MKKEEKKQEEVKMRQIIIETDGTKINLVKADVAGKLELVAILNILLSDMNKPAPEQK